MRIDRRRFLAISAASLAGTGVATAATALNRPRFRALGAECEISLPGDPDRAERAVAEVALAIDRIEQSFSIWRSGSELSRLNRAGTLSGASAVFRHGWRQALELSSQTGGSFDVTVQPLWEAAARGSEAEPVIGWQRVRMDGDTIQLDQGMRATFNGIAQGIAADRAITVLEARGFRDVLVNLGEYHARGLHPDARFWRVGVENPVTGGIGAVLSSEPGFGAIATSEPQGTTIRGQPHILDPLDRPGPRWASVTVRAATAAWADGVSTAIAASPIGTAEELLKATSVREAVLIDPSGGIRHWRA
ncbi:MAG: FAD:protein FMN transferase [Pseudomonadota bacterium]